MRISGETNNPHCDSGGEINSKIDPFSSKKYTNKYKLC